MQRRILSNTSARSCTLGAADGRGWLCWPYYYRESSGRRLVSVVECSVDGCILNFYCSRCFTPQSSVCNYGQLAVLSITDHFTRIKMTSGSTTVGDVRVIGMLFGIQHGRNVEFLSSYEISYSVADGKVALDVDAIKGDTELRT
jgi:hypothetical protein